MLPLSILLLMSHTAAANFPALTAANLNRREVAMPGGFAGERNLLLIAFERKQQAEIDTWLKELPPIAQAHPTLRYYELPTIQKMNRLVRYFIDNGMRGGIPDIQQRERTITLYIDKEPFKRSLEITSEATIYALLIDKSGRVLWREAGRFTAAKGQALQAALAK